VCFGDAALCQITLTACYLSVRLPLRNVTALEYGNRQLTNKPSLAAFRELPRDGHTVKQTTSTRIYCDLLCNSLSATRRPHFGLQRSSASLHSKGEGQRSACITSLSVCTSQIKSRTKLCSKFKFTTEFATNKRNCW